MAQPYAGIFMFVAVLLETYQQGLLAVAGGPLAWFASREAQE
jgi:hypothetical protein